ncbi:hypothetical protein GWI33_018442 [Rhynchophorus ferrugineus]|uniref:CBP80/20-dependent translation initiation factor n=1 Tax=Rhynchophorus ferrugineus TaxID=354439 RepID=A0A834HW54_RHYFE|nr:hypothetical protein GWI33_018442 [Rhynchophorus ferrugineus]
MSSGVGRGRGWLNLGNHNTKNIPGIDEVPTHLSSKQISSPVDKSNDSFNSDASEDFSSLINTIKQLSVCDDGILFNQKIKYIVEKWSTECENAAEVEKSFEAIHKLCLNDWDFAVKVVLLITSRTFLSQEIHEQNIRLMFVRKLQENYENCLQMQSSNINAFRNSILMMGTFFHKAKSLVGNQFAFMATPLISYFEMLLESGQVEDLKLFAMEFYSNGAKLKSICPEKVSELLVKIRQIICTNQNLSKDGKLWLLLSLEIANNRFAILPLDTNNFYIDRLGEAMAYFQGSHDPLTVQTLQENKSLDSYQKNGSVTYNTGVPTEMSQNAKCNQGIKGGKAGRPILGAGARLNRNRNQPDSGSNGNWNKTKAQTSDGDCNWKKNIQPDLEQTGTTNWYKNKVQNDDANWRDGIKGNHSNHKSLNGDWEKRKAPPKVTTKGWEHDDRFETDYS